MEQIIIELAKLGPVGVMAAVLVYDVFYLQKKLLQIIENNTRAMQDLKSHCSNK
jgi:hypothetical protein